MPRFDRLEFEHTPEGAGALRSRVETDHDEHYWLRLADENRRQGLHENALRYYSRALEQDKSLVIGWLGQVQMLIALGEYPEAELWSRKALELFRNHGDLLAGRAQALCRNGAVQPAHPLCDAALSQAGQSAYRWLVRGELMVAGRQDIDRHCFDKAMQLDPDWLVPLEIALTYLHYRQPTRALLRARQALEKAPDSPYSWYVQGWCQHELGLDEAARRSLERCLELAPGHLGAQRRLVALANRNWSLGRRLRRLLGRS